MNKLFFTASLVAILGLSACQGDHKAAEEAAKAYNKKSIELFGKTGSLNTFK